MNSFFSTNLNQKRNTKKIKKYTKKNLLKSKNDTHIEWIYIKIINGEIYIVEHSKIHNDNIHRLQYLLYMLIDMKEKYLLPKYTQLIFNLGTHIYIYLYVYTYISMT